MKDWIANKIEEENQIVAKYPFLRLRGINGTVDIESEFPMIGLEIPNGWNKLFYQMCSDIKPILEEEGVINDFYFIQVKEKYNFMRCYSNRVTSQRVEDIVARYEQMACYICAQCGKPAIYEASDYILSFCDDCWKDYARYDKGKKIEFKSFYEKTISFKDEWNRYIKENGYDTV